MQESIAKLRTDIKEAKGRGDERERQQREQLNNMERRVALSIREADTAEAKLELMEGVIDKLKVNIINILFGITQTLFTVKTIKARIDTLVPRYMYLSLNKRTTLLF